MYPASIRTRGTSSAAWTDLSAASEEDVKNFFRLYYAPNNAILAIVGDFDPAQAKAWVAKYFGDIPRGKPITRPTVAPVTLDGEKRLVFEDRVQVPRLYVQWPTVGEKQRRPLRARRARRDPHRPAHGAADQGAGLRPAGGRVGVGACQSTNEDVGEFGMIDHAAARALADRARGSRPTRSSSSSRREGPTAEEIQKATAGEELRVRQRPRVESRQGDAARRMAPDSTATRATSRPIITKTPAVTAADVKRVANKYLDARAASS